MNTKKLILLLSLVIIITSGFSTEKTKQSKKACKYVRQQIDLVEKFHNLEEGYSLELLSASKFLGEISNLKSKWTYSCQSEVPTSDIDVVKWKSWFEANKQNLYWDDQLKIARIQSSVVYK